MEHGVLGDPGVHVMFILERRKEQDTAITQHLKMEVPHAQVLQVMKLPVEVNLATVLRNSLLLRDFLEIIPG